MTEYAIPGELHDRLPRGEMKPPPAPGERYGVLPWLCPTCDQVIAESVITPSRQQHPVTTFVVGFSPRRDPAADEDGVPFWGPSGRAMRGKGERRRLDELSTRSWRRSLDSEGYRRGDNQPELDYAGIEAVTFDTICDNCPRRLRIVLPAP